MTFSERLIVFAHEEAGFGCTMQSRVHEVWARFFGSTLKDDLMYAGVDCFETFPFPKNWQENASLDVAGKASFEELHELLLTLLWLLIFG